MLLQEFNPVFKLTVISEGRGGNSKTCLRGKFQEANQLNKNNRIYSKELLERETTKLQTLIDENRLVGELDHPNYDVVKLQNASHRITGLSWEGNDLIGEMELLSTPAGKVAECLLKDGVQLGISSRALGSLSPCDENEGASKVNDDLDMRTYDLVADPSVKGAFPGLTESVQAESKIKNVYKQVLGEKVFISMLKESLQALIEERKNVSDKPQDVKAALKNLHPSRHAAFNTAMTRRNPEGEPKHTVKSAVARAKEVDVTFPHKTHLKTSVDYRTTDDVRKSISEMESSEMTTDNARDLMEAYSKKKVDEIAGVARIGATLGTGAARGAAYTGGALIDLKDRWKNRKKKGSHRSTSNIKNVLEDYSKQQLDEVSLRKLQRKGVSKTDPQLRHKVQVGKDRAKADRESDRPKWPGRADFPRPNAPRVEKKVRQANMGDDFLDQDEIPLGGHAAAKKHAAAKRTRTQTPDEPVNTGSAKNPPSGDEDYDSAPWDEADRTVGGTGGGEEESEFEKTRRRRQEREAESDKSTEENPSGEDPTEFELPTDGGPGLDTGTKGAGRSPGGRKRGIFSRIARGNRLARQRLIRRGNVGPGGMANPANIIAKLRGKTRPQQRPGAAAKAHRLAQDSANKPKDRRAAFGGKWRRQLSRAIGLGGQAALLRFTQGGADHSDPRNRVG